MFSIMIYSIVGLCAIYTLCVIINSFRNDDCQEEQPNQIKQELTQTDYMMVLDSMLIYGLINSQEHNAYMSNGLSYFKGK